MDSLTGFYTRDFLNEIKDRKGFSVAFLDLDGLKLVNDAFGHLHGDRLIEKFSFYMKRFFSDSIIIRYGGDEFLLLSEGDDLKKECENFIEYLGDKYLEIEGNLIKMRCSIGIHQGEGTLLEAIEKADKALYIAKEMGKNRVVEYGETFVKKEPVFAGRRSLLSRISETVLRGREKLIILTGIKGIGKSRFLKESHKIFENAGLKVKFVKCGYGTEWLPFWIAKGTTFLFEPESALRGMNKISLFREFSKYLKKEEVSLFIIDDAFFLDNFSIQWMRFSIASESIKFIVSGDFYKFIKSKEILSLTPFTKEEYMAFLNRNLPSFERKGFNDLYILTGGIPGFLKEIWVHGYKSFSEIDKRVLLNIIEDRIARVNEKERRHIINCLLRRKKSREVIESNFATEEGDIPEWLFKGAKRIWGDEDGILLREKEILWNRAEERFEKGSIEESIKYLSTLFLIDREKRDKIALKCADMCLNIGAIKEAKEWLKVVEMGDDLTKIRIEARIKELEGDIYGALIKIRQAIKKFNRDEKSKFNLLLDILWLYENLEKFSEIIKIGNRIKGKVREIIPERYDEFLRRCAISLFKTGKMRDALEEAENVLSFVKGRDRVKYGIAIINYLHILSEMIEIDREKRDFVLNLLEEAQEIFNRKGDLYHLSRIYLLHGIFLRKFGDNQGAMKFYSRAERIFLKFEDFFNRAKVLMCKGVVYEIEGNISLAEKSYKEALFILEKMKDKKNYRLISSIYTDMGILHMLHIDRIKGANFLRKALRYAVKSGDKHFIGEGILNLIKAYKQGGRDRVALLLIFKGLKTKGFTKMQYMAFLGNGLYYFPSYRDKMLKTASEVLSPEEIERVKAKVESRRGFSQAQL